MMISNTFHLFMPLPPAAQAQYEPLLCPTRLAA